MSPSAPGAQDGLRIFRFAAALGIIGGVTAVYLFLIPANSTTVALSLLLCVLGIAAKWSLAEAVTASIASALCFNHFFLPPTGTWTIEDPQNWAALGAFLVTAVVGSHLSAGIRKRATEAVQRQREMERLYALSRALMLAESEQHTGRQIVHLLTKIFEAAGAAIYDPRKNEVYRAGDIPIKESLLRRVAGEKIPLEDPGSGISVVNLEGDPGGSLALSGVSVSQTALQSAASLAAIALDRAQGLEAASRAEAARQSQELKSTLLDALAHEFKTPLTSIKAAATALLSDSRLDPAHNDLLKIIDQEASRVNSMVTEAIQVARIEAGNVVVSPVVTDLTELVDYGLFRLGARLEDHPVEIQIPADLPVVSVDRDLILIVIAHLLDNAVKYSPAGKPIRVSATAKDGAVTVSVSDCGPGIDLRDANRIFERFYRGEATKNEIPGTGMGLAIAKEIVKLHGGLIWVKNLPEGGARFSFSIPASRIKATV